MGLLEDVGCLRASPGQPDAHGHPLVTGGRRDDRRRRCGSVLGIAEYHPRPIAGEALHDCSADSTGFTGHERRPTCECAHLFLLAVVVVARMGGSLFRLGEQGYRMLAPDFWIAQVLP